MASVPEALKRVVGNKKHLFTEEEFEDINDDLSEMVLREIPEYKPYLEKNR